MTLATNGTSEKVASDWFKGSARHALAASHCLSQENVPQARIHLLLADAYLEDARRELEPALTEQELSEMPRKMAELYQDLRLFVMGIAKCVADGNSTGARTWLELTDSAMEQARIQVNEIEKEPSSSE